MTFLLLIYLWQPSPKQGKPIDLTSPRSVSIPVPQQPITSPLNVDTPTQKTTPHLSPSSDLNTSYQMGIEVGDQRRSIDQVASKVAGLEEKREKMDRPDIDGLKDSRRYFGWVTSLVGAIIAIVAGLLWRAKGYIWEDSIRPRLRRELVDSPPSPPGVP